jgi:hypothetical protein
MKVFKGVIIDLANHVPFNHDFGSLEELYDLGNILELFKRQSGIVSFGFLDELKYWNIKRNDDKFRFEN